MIPADAVSRARHAPARHLAALDTTLAGQFERFGRLAHARTLRTRAQAPGPDPWRN